MPRKRKIATAQDREMMPPPATPSAAVKKKKTSKKNAVAPPIDVDENAISVQRKATETCPLTAIFDKAQSNESLHTKYFKEMNNIYGKMEHPRFMAYFLKGMRMWMKFDEANHFANVGLKFCAKYLTSLGDDAASDTHPMLVSTFEYLLSTVSMVTTVRFRLCQFVNLLLSFMGSEAALDDIICTNIMKYMLDRLKDMSAPVRVQAVQALQRLQAPDNPQDKICRSYLFHLANDPSSAVRMAVVTAIGRNYHTIPSILDRLWDIDERVRRHTYLQMSSFPVKSYKVVQRITFLEQGLNDDSDGVRKVVTSVLLPQWLQSYQQKYLALVSALKLDANEMEIKRFIKIARQTLFAIFKNESVDKLIEALPLTSEGGEFEKCVPFDKLTVEITVYWLSLIEHLQSLGFDGNENDIDDGEDHLQHVICELSTFCDYLTKFYNYIDEIELSDSDQWVVQENRYKFMTLIDILLTFDLGDEIGRKNLQEFIAKVLSTRTLEEEVIRKLVCCVENLIPDVETRLQFFVDIVLGYTEPSDCTIDFGDTFISNMLDGIKEPNVRMKVTQLRLKILDLREQETNATQVKDYERLEKITEELTTFNEELVQIVCEIYPEHTSVINSTLSKLDAKKMTRESTLQCLQICVYAVVSKHTSTLTPNICQLYKDFIRRQMESKHMSLRDWALKCGVACSLLYEQLAKDAYNRLRDQFFKHHNTCIWTTSIKGTFELIDKYGIEYFEQDGDVDKNVPKTKKTRQLYNTMGYLDEQPDDDESEQAKQGCDIIFLFSHFMETCQEVSIMKALITGFCRLVLSGRVQKSEFIPKLMLRFFSPTTDPEINQILAIFFQALIKRQQHQCLATALLPTLFNILDAANDSPLLEVKPEKIIKFVVNSTMPAYCSPGLNIHNEIAHTFLSVMNDNSGNKELLQLLSKELLTLQVSDDASLRGDLQSVSDDLLDRTIDAKTETNIQNFKEILAGTYKGSAPRPTDARTTTDMRSIEEDADLVEAEEGDGNQDDDANAQNGEIEEPRVVKSSQFVTSTQNTAANGQSVMETSDITVTSTINDPVLEHTPMITLTPPDDNIVNGMDMANGEEPPKAKRTVTRGKGNTKTPIKPTRQTKNVVQSKPRAKPQTTVEIDVVSSSSNASDDDNDENETIPGTPIAEQVTNSLKMRKVFDQQNNNSPSRTPKNLSGQESSSPKRLKEKNVKVIPEVNHRLSRAMVKVQRLLLDVNGNPQNLHRTRNARVAEFKQTNVMTRNRLSVDSIKSPTQRIEHLKRIAPELNGSNVNSNTSSRTSSRKSSISSNLSSSPRRHNGQTTAQSPTINGRRSVRQGSLSPAPSTITNRRKQTPNGRTKKIEKNNPINGSKRDRLAMLRQNSPASHEQTPPDTRSPLAKRRASKNIACKSPPSHPAAPSPQKLRRSNNSIIQNGISSKTAAATSTTATASTSGTRSSKNGLNISMPIIRKTKVQQRDRSLPVPRMSLRKKKN